MKRTTTPEQSPTARTRQADLRRVGKLAAARLARRADRELWAGIGGENVTRRNRRITPGGAEHIGTRVADASAQPLTFVGQMADDAPVPARSDLTLIPYAQPDLTGARTELWRPLKSGRPRTASTARAERDRARYAAQSAAKRAMAAMDHEFEAIARAKRARATVTANAAGYRMDR